MAYVFPSAEWVEQVAIEINGSDAYAAAAKTWEGDFYFVVKPGPEIEEPFKIYLDLWHGKCRDAYVVTGAETKQPEFVIAATLDIYRQVFTKTLEPTQALMTRKLEIRGNMLKIMKSMQAFLELVECCSKIDAVYPDLGTPARG